MKLEEEIKQKKFRSEKHKAIINLMYTGSWVYSINKSILKTYNISTDRRQVDITITDEGLDLLKKIDRQTNISDQALENLSEEEAVVLNELLDKVRG